MASKGKISGLLGPVHLTTVDWNNTHHRRSIAASLVQGVYTLERDRQQNRHGPQALAPPWWNFFHFQLSSVLVDNTDSTIFGAIYEFKPQAPYNNNSSSHNAPKYVVAFRGTIFKQDSRSQDSELHLQLILNILHESPRSQLAMKAVQNLVAFAGAENIWLAGHSLGSSMAMLAGRNMAKMNCTIETYLFNPPSLSTPIEWMQDPNLKHGIRFARSVFTAGLSVPIKGHNQMGEDDLFVALSPWIPYLFVNPDDLICSEYIGYFEHRKNMEEIGAGYIEWFAMQNSIRSLCLGALGKDSEPLHLVPSAYLTINWSPLLDFRQAHGIQQWWRPDFHCQSKLYQFRRKAPCEFIKLHLPCHW